MKLEIKGRIECNKFIDIAEQKMDNKGCNADTTVFD